MLASEQLGKDRPGLSSKLGQLFRTRTLLMVEVPPVFRAVMKFGHEQTVLFTHRQLLDGGVLQTVRPEVIVAPLMSKTWDILDLGADLERFGHRGQVCVLTEPLPHIELISKEIADKFPSLMISLIEVLGSSSRNRLSVR